MSASRPSADDGRPALRIVHGGEPAAEEVAALVSVLLARSAAAGSAPGTGKRVGGWASRQAAVRRPLVPGPGAWVASARPH